MPIGWNLCWYEQVEIGGMIDSNTRLDAVCDNNAADLLMRLSYGLS